MVDTLTDFIKYKNDPISMVPVPFESGKKSRRIKFTTNSYRGFEKNARQKRKLSALILENVQSLKEGAEGKIPGKSEGVVMAANAYANYQVSNTKLQRAISSLQMLNVRLVVYDFAIKRLQNISAPKQAKLNVSFVEKVRGVFSEFGESMKSVNSTNSKVEQDIYSAIRDRRVDDVRNIVGGTYTPPVNPQVAEPVGIQRENVNSFSQTPPAAPIPQTAQMPQASQPYGMTDEDMKNLTNMFNGLANGTLDVKNGEIRPTLKEETPKVENAQQPGVRSFVKPSDIVIDEVMDLKTQNSELKIRNNGLNDKNMDLTQKLNSAQSRIAELERQLRRNQDLEARASRADETERRVRELESRLNGSELTTSNLRAQISQLQESAKDSFTRAQIAEQELAREKARHAEEMEQMNRSVREKVSAGIDIALQQVLGNYGHPQAGVSQSEMPAIGVNQSEMTARGAMK